MHPVAFGILAALLVLSALGVVLAQSPIRSALSLVVTLFLLAVTFVFLDAPLVAVLQIIVYAGAIMVLFLFVIMLLNLQQDPSVPRHRVVLGLALGGSSILLFSGVWLLRFGVGDAPGLQGPAPDGFGSTESIALRLFTHHLLAFEITGLLLLVAVVGAVVLAKRNLV